MKLTFALMGVMLLAAASFAQVRDNAKLEGIGKTTDGQWLIDGGLHSGDPAAPVKIEIYYDLQCPACARLQDALGKAEQRFKGKLFIVFRYFPLDIAAHDKAIMAARVVEAANCQGKGRSMLDMIFARQHLWTNDAKAKSILFGYAKELRLNMPQFRVAYDDDQTIRSIMNDATRARLLNLNAAPTVFLNDKQLSFADAMELELRIADIIR